MIGEQVKAFVAAPFDPNGDGKTSLLEWFAFVGLVLVFIRIWTVILEYMFGD